jgi:hypothetical protein
MMIKRAQVSGACDALAKFKLGNMMQGAAGYNPVLTGQAQSAQGVAPPAATAPPAPPAAPAAMGAPKAKVLG